MYLFTLRKQFVLFKEFTYETAASNSKRNEVNMVYMMVELHSTV